MDEISEEARRLLLLQTRGEGWRVSVFGVLRHPSGVEARFIANAPQPFWYVALGDNDCHSRTLLEGLVTMLRYRDERLAELTKERNALAKLLTAFNEDKTE